MYIGHINPGNNLARSSKEWLLEILIGLLASHHGKEIVVFKKHSLTLLFIWHGLLTILDTPLCNRQFIII